MRLYFTRHGESEANRLKVISNRDLPHPLTDTGRLQARSLAERLRPRPITCVYASPILRACQTGEILSVALKVPLELADSLREPDCGLLEGRGDPQAWEAHHYWLESWLSGANLEKGPAGGETCAAVRARFAACVQSLVRQFGDSPAELVLVTHGEAMVLCLPGLVPALTPDIILESYLGHTAILPVDCLDGKLCRLESF